MMNEDAFRRILRSELIPMLEGELSQERLDSSSRDQLVSYANPCRLTVKLARDADFKLAIDRSQPFTADERRLAGQFAEELATVKSIEAGKYQSELVQAIPLQVVAKHLKGGSALLNVLRHLQMWSSQTYEGQRIVASFGIIPENGTSENSINGFWKQDFAPVLTNGIDTIIVCNKDGYINGFRQLSYENASRTAPYRLRQIAWWSKNARISVVLNRQGEILVFKTRSLKFAFRRGRWSHYAHEASIRRMSPPQDRSLREALYESCLDVSFARTGGCIGVIMAGNLDQLDSFVSESDIISRRRGYKTKFLSKVASKSFQKLDRRFRQELLSMDGAVILDHQGHVLAAGAIVQVPAGSEEGGRFAAARRLSSVGLGIKISEDGTIIGLRNEEEILRT